MRCSVCSAPMILEGAQELKFNFHSCLLKKIKILFLLHLLLSCQGGYGSDFREPYDKQFSIWPNIPVIRASDLQEYALDRQVFAELHEGKDPDNIIRALAAVDSLQSHHEQRALAELGRSFNVQLIGELDGLVRANNIEVPKLRFWFNDISPPDLQRPNSLDINILNKLKTKAAEITLVAYITYTRLANNYIQMTCTLVKLKTGESESFSVNGHVEKIGAILARNLFNYFYGNRFPYHINPIENGEWVLPGQGHAGQLVSRKLAENFCRSQNSELPTAEELEIGEALGFYHGGISLVHHSYYHIKSGLYYSSETQDPRGKTRPNFDSKISNGYYYCIRKTSNFK